MTDVLLFALTYTIPFLIILTTVITVHELGHFWVARTFGVAVDRFAIGFGRAIFSRTDKSGVEWRIGWIPLGGYVRFGGDTNDASLPDADDLQKLKARIIEAYGPEAVKRYYHFKPVWQRAIIAAAGPVANFILAFFLFCAVLLVGSRWQTPPVVGEVIPNTPAAMAGFEVGDRVLKANDMAIRSFEDLQAFVGQRAGDRVRFEVNRDEETVPLTTTLTRAVMTDPMTGFGYAVGSLGIKAEKGTGGYVKTPLPQIPLEAGGLLVKTIEGPIRYIGRIVTGRENGDQLSGIVGIATTSGKVAEKSLKSEETGQRFSSLIFNMVQMIAFVSVAIGFVNLLPVPVLDGGHLMFYAYEAVARRPVGARIQEASYKVGLALVLGLMLFATWNDLQRLQAFKIFGGLFS